MKKTKIYQHPELDGSSFYFREGDTAVICFHGFTATTTEVRPVAEYLAGQGFAVAAPLLPGHGTTPEDLNTKTFHDWMQTAEHMLEIVNKNHKRVFVLGESMGALIALLLLAEHPNLCGGMILAPAICIPKLWQSKLVWPFIKLMPKGGDGDDSMPWKGYNILPVRAAASLYDFQQVVRKSLPHVEQPVIVFQGKQDRRIDPLGAELIVENVRSAETELVILENSGHVILLDKEASIVYELCRDFIHRYLKENKGESIGL